MKCISGADSWTTSKDIRIIVAAKLGERLGSLTAATTSMREWRKVIAARSWVVPSRVEQALV
jgi:hypothetical protein